MEPGFNAPRTTPEQAPSLPPVSPELVPGAGPERSAEREPRRFEQERAAGQEQAPPLPTTVTIPVLPTPVVTDDDASDDATLLTAVPDVAADDDLIEKEWVDKAKRIIAETADDPYTREQAVSQLQREYLRKRYGKEVGATE